MTDLGPRARALVEQSRNALRPTPGDHARIESALRARLGPAALPADIGGSQVTGAAAGMHGLFRVVVGVCVVGGGVAFLALRPSASAPVPSPRVVAPPAATFAPVEEPAEPLVTDPVTAELQLAAPAPPPAAAPRRRDPLAAELSLLSRATQELRAGRARSALKALDEHQRRFPNGTLIEERRAARAQALCSLGRVGEGRTEQAKLEPNSPAAARAREVCDAKEAL